MRARAFVGLALLMGAAACASAPADAPAKVAAQSKPADADKQICKDVTPTGSVMPKRTCATKAQWDAAARSDRDVVEGGEDLRRQASSGKN